MREFCLYVFYRAGFALITALPLRGLFRIGQLLGFCAWLILPRYRRLALRNASIAFGKEKSLPELRRLVRRHFQRLGANLLCSVKVAVMPLDQLERRIKIENLDVVDRQLRAGRAVVLVLSHLSNWELIAQILPKFIGHVRNSTIYQKLGNHLIDEHLRKLRARAGVEMFDRKEGFRKAIELLRGGGAIGILSDQHAGDQGLWVPFFGKLASTSPLPALLAKRTDAALVGIALYTDGVARWRMVVEPALDTRGDSVESLTAKSNEILAAQIRRAPEDWFWVHNRWKTPRPNFLLSRYKRGVYLLPDQRAQDLKPFRLLIRASNWLGDAVMSMPAVRAIKNGRPDVHLTVMTRAKLAPVWKLIPEVDEIISLPGNSLLATVRSIRRQREFDVAILFPGSVRTALEAWLSGIARRVGYRGHFRAWLLNQIVREPRHPGPLKHQAVRYLRIAQDCGAEVENNWRDALRRVPNISDGTEAVPPSSRNTIGLCPGAEYGPAKRWLPERFAEVAGAITAEKQIRWILFGTAKDAAPGDIIAIALGDNCVNRIGETTLEQLIDELRTCRLLLTNDTGTMHLASLLGVPTVAVFGSTEPHLTGPIGTDHIILRHHVECSPCFLRECPIDFRCMKAVSVAEVRDAVLSILQRNGETITAKNTKLT
ncbi:MAG: lipopolysaccharide heptosyltransferase II [Verrucomicrobiota bacterium]|nr:lipopolysaccharide heptosyltransferase II [Verrucomicrobiota bacterium]